MHPVNIESVIPGMKIGVPIRDANENILLNRNIIITERYINKLKSLGYQSIIVLDDEDTADLIAEDNISEHTRSVIRAKLKNSFELSEKMIKEFKDESMKEVFKNIRSDKFKKNFSKIKIYENLQEVIEQLIEQVLSNDVLNGLNSLKTYDNYTYNHSIDVVITSVMLGKKLGFSGSMLDELAMGCLMHDIGKIFIDKKILNKQDKLTPEEFEKIKEHPTFGYEIMSGRRILASHVTYQHHERQDGKGYPRGLKGNNKINRETGVGLMSLFGEISAIADVHDAMISDRVYRKGFPPDIVIKFLINNAGIHLNRELLEKFLKFTPMYPVGYKIQILNGGYEDYFGVVAKINNKDLNRPIIRILYDYNRKKIKPKEIDLSKEKDIEIKCIKD